MIHWILEPFSFQTCNMHTANFSKCSLFNDALVSCDVRYWIWKLKKKRSGLNSKWHPEHRRCASDKKNQSHWCPRVQKRWQTVNSSERRNKLSKVIIWSRYGRIKINESSWRQWQQNLPYTNDAITIHGANQSSQTKFCAQRRHIVW